MRKAVTPGSRARAVIRRMSEFSLRQSVAALWRDDASFVDEWQAYMVRNRTALRATPLYGDGVQRVYRQAAQRLAHLTYSLPEEKAPDLLCEQTYRLGTRWYGWRTDDEREHAHRVRLCTACHRAYLSAVEVETADECGAPRGTVRP